MSAWSGLAPAVNSHLARWERVESELKRLERMQGTILDPLRYPVAAAWVAFAKSWGLPQKDGSVVSLLKFPDGATVTGREQFEHHDDSWHIGPILMDKEHKMLAEATTMYVSGPIVNKVSGAALSAEPEPLFDTDLLTPYGLMVLEKPLLVPDLHPDTGEIVDFLHVPIRAIGWQPEGGILHTSSNTLLEDGDLAPKLDEIRANRETGPGVMITTYSTPDDWRDVYWSEHVDAVRRGLIDPEPQWEDFMAGGTSPPPPRAWEGEKRDALIPMDVLPWAFGASWRSRTENYHIPGTMDSVVSWQRRWFLTLMRFTWQRIVVPERPDLHGKLKKRVFFSKRPSKAYTVLRLRRTTEKDTPTGTGAPLSYRQHVAGCWKRQYYPKLGPARNPDGSWNPDSHRLIWVDAYWRGPEDGPEGPTHHAVTVVR